MQLRNDEFPKLTARETKTRRRSGRSCVCTTGRRVANAVPLHFRRLGCATMTGPPIDDCPQLLGQISHSIEGHWVTSDQSPSIEGLWSDVTIEQQSLEERGHVYVYGFGFACSETGESVVLQFID
ncbi:hypothetical protein HPB50_024046 [Hyalomma asiaticum]|uniref:Uncharacterized protein n=1 Tax=Hyalomma asiaticum TaxID=266040 RepID=A0ACB7SPU2_HYAAI|nr:hypothetical protein HPB50_024046 [Hyalomma asiaticum]